MGIDRGKEEKYKFAFLGIGFLRTMGSQRYLCFPATFGREVLEFKWVLM